MRTLCDVCEGAPAILFCSADEASLCASCDDKVHKCNKLASRHVRVGLAKPTEAPRCDICENAPAFFYCEVDGSSLCLQCDMLVHVGGKRTHERYLLLRQRVEFPGDISLDDPGLRMTSSSPLFKQGVGVDNMNNNTSMVIHNADVNADGDNMKSDNQLLDLNMQPHRFHGQSPNNRDQ